MKEETGGRKFKASISGHIVPNGGGRYRDVRNYEIAIGKIATMIDVERTESVALLFAVLDQAICDVAMVSAPHDVDEDDFIYNVPEAAGFLMGHRGKLYMEALGIDHEKAKYVLQSSLGSEFNAASKAPSGPKAMVLNLLTADKPMTVKELAGLARKSPEWVNDALRVLRREGKVKRERIKAAKGPAPKYAYSVAA